ncbi:endonuclease/exonuclease/phosphatase family protein [Streptomyces sp. ACA25]|uniref:endonuclease/exonuclease/phosphatase family protein n=1 Tax=Streptomyces sp. ACA25 TaxID=3022596 RepID=UPI002306E558|nr:endonuclease/exonuclease/phosphatase family protein [Streptomyces sp. ACA25]MDB1087837.1 endonuclease/exonuclease/phosphatase family protein [Streptomyces sp. ACA25]
MARTNPQDTLQQEEGNTVDDQSGRPRWKDRRGRWRRGWVISAAALLTTLLMLFHSRVPNSIGHLGSLLQTFLPWTGLAVPLLLAAAVVRRSLTAVLAVLVPAALWLNLFGGLLADKTQDGGALLVVSHNVDAENPDPTGTAQDLISSRPDVLALQEIPHGQRDTYAAALADTYPHHAMEGTVGVWSRYPLSHTRPVDIGMGWPRAMRSTVRTPDGDIAVYVAHLPSVRLQFRAGFTAGQRDDAADRLAHSIVGDPVEKVVLLGDLNGTMNDRALAPLTSHMRSTQGATGAGFGFTFPARFPVTRIDQILVRGIEPVSSWTLPATTSDHLPVAARIEP